MAATPESRVAAASRHFSHRPWSALLGVALLLAACDGAQHAQPTSASAKPQAPLIEGLGTHRHPITTTAPLAQRFFDQGLVLAWAFEHGEAARAFREAARLDPRCAMCEWGIAYALGPNINHPHADGAQAARHAERALALAGQASERERAYICAIAVRHGVPISTAVASGSKAGACGNAPPQQSDLSREALDRHYARAMTEVARAYPEDIDAAVLQAEAMMMLSAWDWWARDGTPRPEVPEILRILERVLERAPQHPAANHYYVHALEGSPHPGRALDAAARLGTIAPAAGHLVHMPAHAYMRVGRYHDATRANQAAIQADRYMVRQLCDQGFAPLGHVAHHQHFLWVSAAMEGRGALALEAARHLADIAARPDAPFGSDGSNDYYLALPLFAQVRFGRWNEILATPALRGASAYPEAVWHFARGVALARTGQPRDARGHLRALDGIISDDTLAGKSLKGIDSLASLLAIGSETLRAEIAFAEQRAAQAIRHLQRAVLLEDALDDEEPPPWLGPTRHRLGAVLLAAGRPRAAEKIYREDLRRHPANGWALHGLSISLHRQGKTIAASEAQTAWREAWQHADPGVKIIH